MTKDEVLKARAIWKSKVSQTQAARETLANIGISTALRKCSFHESLAFSVVGDDALSQEQVMMVWSVALGDPMFASEALVKRSVEQLFQAFQTSLARMSHMHWQCWFEVLDPMDTEESGVYWKLVAEFGDQRYSPSLCVTFNDFGIEWSGGLFTEDGRHSMAALSAMATVIAESDVEDNDA